MKSVETVAHFAAMDGFGEYRMAGRSRGRLRAPRLGMIACAMNEFSAAGQQPERRVQAASRAVVRRLANACGS
jgi:hypothetical protein